MRKNLIVNSVLIFHNASKNIKLANNNMVQVMGLMQEERELNNMNFESSPISAMNHYITWCSHIWAICFFNAELFFKWSNANLSISKMKISLECLSINYMLPSARAPLIFCWCGVPSRDYVVRRHLFCTRKYWCPNTIFHLGKSFNIISNDGFCYVWCSQILLTFGI